MGFSYFYSSSAVRSFATLDYEINDFTTSVFQLLQVLLINYSSDIDIN
jgi:hypothetical protein